MSMSTSVFRFRKPISYRTLSQFLYFGLLLYLDDRISAQLRDFIFFPCSIFDRCRFMFIAEHSAIGNGLTECLSTAQIVSLNIRRFI